MIKSVLIVDPNPADSKTLQQRLKTLYGCKVTLAGRTLIAEEELQTRKGRIPFDLIILDIEQPDSVDVQSIIRLRNMDKNIPILVIANHVEPVIFFRGRKAGATEYVSKEYIKTDYGLHRALILTKDRWALRG